MLISVGKNDGTNGGWWCEIMMSKIKINDNVKVVVSIDIKSTSIRQSTHKLTTEKKIKKFVYPNIYALTNIYQQFE